MKRSFSYILFAFLLYLVLAQRGFFTPEVALAGVCKQTKYESSENKVHLIELFTSEGCSSCPPAEKWLNSLYADNGLWKSFVPLAFHVDYWDYIGWKDEMAKPEYSTRQRRYAKEWKAKNIYTPAFVLNGKEWRNFTLRSVPSSSSEKVGKLSVETIDKKVKIQFQPINLESKNLLFHMALLGHGIENEIKRGENKGKILKHNFVVLNAISISPNKKENYYIAEASISKSAIKAKEFALAIWVTTKQSLKPIQAIGGCLNI